MNEKLNVVTLTTAGESPFSNGTVEHHNLVVSESMRRLFKMLNVYQRLLWPGRSAQRILYRIMEGLAQISWYLDTT